MTTATAPTITETRYAKLKAKLRELFELDKSDLDFGIYRIMAAKNKEVTDFLDRQLKDKVKATLAEHGSGELDNIKTELEETIASLRDNAVPEEQIETNAKVVGLRERLEAAGGKTGEELEADIYNHLLAFFSRYYDEGDFISQRRYKGDTYAIPYSGEEVTLHWANKDQYYIKSGEWHKDYRFKLSNGKRVQFALVDATQETGNNKEADESKRRFILVEDNPVSISGDTLTLRFHFRAPTESEKKRADGEDADQPPVAIFGGKYAKSTKGDERERFCADAEKRAIPHIPAEWAKLVLETSATDAKPERTLLGKHLDAFTARNTFDYFIHKDLGEFLSRELDFYIKNEVVRLDDLDKAPADHLQRIQGRVKAIRAVASSIIDLLASIENFQKKLWLKKKFVLNTSWLITIDRIPESLRDVIAENQSQWDEWEKLGFKPKDDEIEGLFEGAKWGTRAYLDACDKLVVDTRLFDEEFTADVLASEEALDEATTFDDAKSGTLINGENSQAVELVLPCVGGSADCVYLDPPYNTDAGPIIYKNGYRSSTWMAMIEGRVSRLQRLLRDTGVFCITIDDYQVNELATLLDSELGKENQLGVAVIRNNPSGRSTVRGFSICHEYALFYRASESADVARLPRSEKQLGRFTLEDGKHVDWRNFRKDGGAVTHRAARPKQYYPLYVERGTMAIRVPAMQWDKEKRVWQIDEEPRSDEVAVWPIDEKGRDRVWSLNHISAIANMNDLEARDSGERGIQVYRRHEPADGVLPRTWWDKKEYAAREYGSSALTALFGAGSVFSFAKSPFAVQDCIWVGGLNEPDGSLVVDYFGGSGTTAHSVISLNRADAGGRRFVLVEMGEYFDTVLIPRVSKVLYSPDWKEGTAQSHDSGLSALVKCFAVESYEDALNNLPAPTGGMFDGQSPEQQDALIKYALDLEMGPNLLDLDIFRDPWGHTINAQLAGDDEIKQHKVDLVETFNYLLGLRVSAYGPIERYSAEFERSEHKDDLGRLKLKGRLKRDPEGPFKFHRVEGILNDESNTRVLVVWRTLTDDPEKDSAVLDAWMSRHRQETTERTEHRDYHQIYINGPVTLPQPTQEIRTVYPIEETFKQKMFEDTDGVT
ncbi:MAG: DNA methyltransferase [Phycisphaerales bacterium JB052]